jgi:hypothetical protein
MVQAAESIEVAIHARPGRVVSCCSKTYCSAPAKSCRNGVLLSGPPRGPDDTTLLALPYCLYGTYGRGQIPMEDLHTGTSLGNCRTPLYARETADTVLVEYSSGSSIRQNRL